MSQCVICRDFFPPKFMIEVDEFNMVKKCVFCHLQKDYVTMIDDKTKKEEKITKTKIKEDYKKYISELKNSKRVQEIIKPKSNIIMPY